MTFSRKKKKLEKPTNKLRPGIQNMNSDMTESSRVGRIINLIWKLTLSLGVLVCRFFFFLEKEFFILLEKVFFRKKEKQKTHGKKILLVFPKLYFFQKNPPNSKKSMCSHTLSVIDRSNWILLLAIDYRKSFSSTTSFAKE